MPRVSIVMPCLDEEAYIERALRSLMDDWSTENCEVLVVDGGSADGTKRAAAGLIGPPETPGDGARSGRGAAIRILDNPDRTAAAGMNLGIAGAAGEIIVRADAHCLFPPAYARRCVELLETTGAANAGGVMVPRGEGGATQAAIALALGHPLGTGDAPFRRAEFRGEAEGVIFGTFRKSLFDEIGGYDPRAPANEDSELNIRILRAGKKIFLDSGLKIVYFPRKTLGGLARQYFRYGRGRAWTTKKHKKLTGPRQAAAPALVLLSAGGLVLAALGNPVLLLVPAAYLMAALGAAMMLRERGGDAGPAGGGAPPTIGTRLTVAAAWVVMHLCWGLGFLFGLADLRRRRSCGTPGGGTKP